MGRTIKVAIIGSGTVAEHGHIPAYKGQPDVKIEAVVDVVGERAKRLAEELGAKYAFVDYQELMQVPEIEAVSICTPNKFHAPIAIAALKAGKHVLCEKPPAMNTAEAQAMVEAARANRRILMCCLNNRFQPEVQLLRRCVEEGELGHIYYAKTGILRRRGNPGGAFASKELSGGGPLIDIGVHCLDWTWFCMGCPQPVAVYGQSYREIGSYHLTYETSWVPADLRGKKKEGDWAGNVEDLAVATVKMADGATLRVEVSWTLNNDKSTQFTELYGDKAGASLGPLTIHGQERGRLFDKVYQVPEQSTAKTHNLAVRHFLDCVESGSQPLTSGEQIVTLMKMLDAIRDSSETGELIKL